MQIAGIDHVVFRVRDLDRAVRFYQDVLGCPVERWRDDIGMVQMRAGTSLIDLVAADGHLGRKGGEAAGTSGHNVDHVCLTVVDFNLEEVRRHLVSHGVTEGESGLRYGAGGEGPSIYLHDPDGNGLELRAA